LRLEPDLRRAFRPAPADAVLLRFSAHHRYQSETQKAALRALLTAPPGASLAVSMPTGSGKSPTVSGWPKILTIRAPRRLRPGDHAAGRTCAGPRTDAARA
jgi:hypothetical protein